MVFKGKKMDILGVDKKTGFDFFLLLKSFIINPSANQLIFSLYPTFSVVPVKVD